jgi:hypothetical protein
VVVPEASVVYYKLVLDPNDGTLLGAGVVPPEELGIVTDASGWSRIYSVGIGVPFAATSNVVGVSNQTSLGVALTFDYYAVYAELEEGFVRIDPENQDALPTQKTNDRLRFDQLYTRFMAPRIGPYVRFGLLSNVFESNVLVTEPTIVVKRPLEGAPTSGLVVANDTFQVGGSFAPVLVREGVGANIRLVRSRLAYLDWRVGLGFRQNQYRGAYVEDSFQETVTGPNILTYREQESFNQTGVETTIVGDVRVNRLLLNTNFDLFGDFDEPTLDWRNTFGWRLTGALSVDYRLDLFRQPQVTTDTQIRQNLLFRYSWGS